MSYDVLFVGDDCGCKDRKLDLGKMLISSETVFEFEATCDKCGHKSRLLANFS